MKKILYFRRPLIKVLVSVGLFFGQGLCHAAHVELDVSTDFEGISSNDFTVGSSPLDARFTGGASNVLGISELYASGIFAWMVDPSATGTIEFNAAVSKVGFSARTRLISTEDSVLTAFNGSEVVDSLRLTAADGWVEVLFTGSITRIEYQNFDANQVNSLDNFGFSVTAVPLPATAWLFGSGLLGLLGFARREIKN